jgi:hypothetical protein
MSRSNAQSEKVYSSSSLNAVLVIHPPNYSLYNLVRIQATQASSLITSRGTACNVQSGTFISVSSIPIVGAGILLKGRPDLVELTQRHLVRVGGRSEVDLDTLGEDGQAGCTLAEVLRDYTKTTTEDTVKVRRLLGVFNQRNTKTIKEDLNELFDALGQTPGLSTVLTLATEPSVDEARLLRAVEGLKGSLKVDEGATTIVVEVPPQGLSEALGGVCQPNEVSREVTLGVRHAPWRDRRVRRLSFVHLNTIEKWPNPTTWVSLLPEQIDMLS